MKSKRAARVGRRGPSIVEIKPIEHPGMANRRISPKRNRGRTRKEHTRCGRVRQRPFCSLVREVVRIITMHRCDKIRVLVGKEETCAGTDFQFAQPIPLPRSQEKGTIGIA